MNRVAVVVVCQRCYIVRRSYGSCFTSRKQNTINPAGKKKKKRKLSGGRFEEASLIRVHTIGAGPHLCMFAKRDNSCCDCVQVWRGVFCFVFFSLWYTCRTSRHWSRDSLLFGKHNFCTHLRLCFWHKAQEVLYIFIRVAQHSYASSGRTPRVRRELVRLLCSGLSLQHCVLVTRFKHMVGRNVWNPDVIFNLGSTKLWEAVPFFCVYWLMTAQKCYINVWMSTCVDEPCCI